MPRKNKIARLSSDKDEFASQSDNETITNATTGQAKQDQCRDDLRGSPGNGGPTDLGPIIRAPLDTKSYKAIELANGLKALLVSTCDHQLDLRGCCKSITTAQCKYQKIKEFNRKFLEIDTHHILSESMCPGSICTHNEEDVPPSCRDPSCGSNALKDPEQIKDPRVLQCPRGYAAASLCVAAGSFHDPPDIHGLAHLCEHCVFLGSKKYPIEGQLFQMAHKHKGGVNAMTQPEYTNYFMYSPCNVFEVLLDPFADLIAEPLLRPESIKREVEAVDSEFAMKKTCDATRVYDFMGYLSKKCHPMGKFYWGNKKSLNVKNLPDKMVEWHKRHYCANFMTICLQGPLSIKDLEGLAVKYFSRIRRTHLPHPRADLLRFGDPFTPEVFSKIYHMVPVANVRWILISWCWPANLWQDFQSKPLNFIKVILNSEAVGGLYDYLRQKHWVTNFHSSCTTTDNFYRNTFCSVYRLFIELTMDGQRNRNRILGVISSYIKMLKQLGSQSKQRIFEELKRTQASIWHYNNWEEIFDSTIEMGTNLQKVPPKYVLTSKTLVTRYNKEQINRVLNLMDLRNANIIFIAREFANEKNQINVMNGRFIYTENTILPELSAELEQVPILSEFKPPGDNTFLSKELESPHPEDFVTIEGANEILFESDRLLINYFKKYTERGPSFTARLPSATYNFYIYSPVADQHEHMPLIETWINLLKMFMGRRINNAFNSLISYNLEPEQNYIHLKVEGPSFHLTDLIKANLEVFENFEPLMTHPQYFEDQKQEVIESFENMSLDNIDLSKDILQYILLNSNRTIFHWITVLKGTDYKDFIRFVRHFKAEMFFEVEACGSVTQADLDEVKAQIESLTYSPYDRPLQDVEQATLLPLGCKYLRIRANHQAYHTSVVLNHYQFGGIQSDDEIEIWQFFYMILKRDFFSRLRTKEQLGYAVGLERWYECGCRGLNFRVITQPEKFTTEHVDSQIDKFIGDFYKFHFKTQSSFENLVSQYCPNSNITYLMAKDMFKNYLIPLGEDFRKLSIQLVGFKANTTTRNPTAKPAKPAIKLVYEVPAKMANAKDKFIMDIKDFKESLELQPNLDEAD